MLRESALGVLEETRKPERVSGEGGPELVSLDRDHPGFRDPDYRARRDAIALLALERKPGEPPPRVNYTQEEQAVWGRVLGMLAERHREMACAEYLLCLDAVALERDRIPQLEEVNAVIQPLTGFRMLPVAGLVGAGDFLARLADGVFLSTQYVRHHSRPLYTPEPDVIHELVGHAATFAHPGYSSLSRQFGQAARGASDRDIERIARVYWFTLEFGAVLERGAKKAYGAGLLSSPAELDRLKNAETRPFAIEEIAETPFDPTDFQPYYFLAPGFSAMVEEVSRFLSRIR